MDAHFKASSRVYLDVSGSGGSGDSVRSTSWIVKNVSWVPRVGDVLHEEEYHWWDVTEIYFNHGMDLVTATLVRQEINPVLEISEWEDVLRWVGDREQLGISPLGPPAAGDETVHTSLRPESKLRDGIMGPLKPDR